METGGKQKPGGGQAAKIQVLERATNEGMGTGPAEPDATEGLWERGAGLKVKSAKVEEKSHRTGSQRQMGLAEKCLSL